MAPVQMAYPKTKAIIIPRGTIGCGLTVWGSLEVVDRGYMNFLEPPQGELRGFALPRTPVHIGIRGMEEGRAEP